MVKISLIVTDYNDEKYLKNCLDSIIKQSLHDMEIICINDESSDNIAEIIKNYAHKDKRIKCINQEYENPTAARNKAIEIAQGEYIGFVDGNDILINKDSLKIMYMEGDSNNADFISANIKFLTQKHTIKNTHYLENNIHNFDENDIISPDEYGMPVYLNKNLIKTEFIKKYRIEFPDILMGNESIFLSEILSKIDKIYGVCINYYGYLPKIQLDTYLKKFDYIYQYKECVDILNQSELFKTSNQYIKNLMLFLNESNKNNDFEVYEIVQDIFGDDESYFENYIKQYRSFKASFTIKMIFEINTDEYYYIAKANIDDDEITDDDLVKKINILTSSNSFNEFKITMLQYELDKYNSIATELKKENKLLTDKLNTTNSPSKLHKIKKLFNRG